MTVIAVATRSGMVECEYHGHVAVTGPTGELRFSVGDPDLITYPRSANKLMQAGALTELGLVLPPRLLAHSASSHSGERFHQDATLEILSSAGLTASDLENTPTLPYELDVAFDFVRSGGVANRIVQNCSGKHAAMIATCVHNEWPTKGYLDPDHPIQVAVTRSLESAIGTRIDHIGVDGCGAPAHAFALSRLARAYGRSRTGGSTVMVADAMLKHPDIVGGTRRDVTLLMRSMPEVLVKDGADGVIAAALPDGTGIAVKISDGSSEPRIAVLLSVLERLGVDVRAARIAVPLHVFGHGEPVGEVRSTLA